MKRLLAIWYLYKVKKIYPYKKHRIYKASTGSLYIQSRKRKASTYKDFVRISDHLRRNHRGNPKRYLHCRNMKRFLWLYIDVKKGCGL